MEERSVFFLTASDGETLRLGQELGRNLSPGDLIALVGGLGSGKTCLAKGIGIGLGVASNTVITSPSFTLVNEYDGRCKFFHMDGYRLETLSDFLAAGLEEYLYQDAVVALEWADRWHEILSEWRLRVEIKIVDLVSRKIIISGRHPRSLDILEHIERLNR